MNQIWTQFLRPVYRKEPISSFILTMGIVDAVIGGSGSHWVLMSLGVGAMVGAIGLRWWIHHSRQSVQPVEAWAEPPVRYLPSQSSRPSLPDLPPARKRNQ